MTKRLVLLVALAFFLCMSASCSKGREEPKQADSSTAPLFTVKDIDGNKLDIADYRGKVVILEFFATWCEPCRISAPDMQSVYERYKGRGLVVIAIAEDEGAEAAARVRSFVKDYRLSYHVAADGGQIMKQYGVYSLPTTFIIDHDGKIISKHLGISINYAKRLSAEVEPLLK